MSPIANLLTWKTTLTEKCVSGEKRSYHEGIRMTSMYQRRTVVDGLGVDVEAIHQITPVRILQGMSYKHHLRGHETLKENGSRKTLIYDDGSENVHRLVSTAPVKIRPD